MSKIIHLPDHIVSQIAAGEVIERPSFAVKELVENSLDAGATVIEVHVEDAGLKKIQVIDNGEGMRREDLELCFLPHTTSKLLDEQITGIKTLGFRGEALSSIAAISQMVLSSRTKDEAGGTKISIMNGHIEDIAPTGSPKGTSISIHQLFHTVPARKKFLKTAPTELRHITQSIMNYALCYPSVHFVLSHNGKNIFDIPQRDSFMERIKTLLGVSMVDQLIPLSYEDSYLSIEGFIGKPQIASKNNNHQYIFINKRSVTDKLISSAIKESFGSLLPSSSTPVFLLYFTIPFDLVDVNIHPRKEHVAFTQPKLLFDAIKQATTQTLSEHNITFRLSQFKKETSTRGGETTSFSGQLLKETVTQGNMRIVRYSDFYQLADAYILHLHKEGMAIIDQHAAHERIQYELLLRSFHSLQKKKATVTLPTPLTLHLSLPEGQLLSEYVMLIKKIGFTIEHFQGSSFIIRKIPFIFKERNIEKILKDMLSDLESDKGISEIDSMTQRMIAYLACRSSVMAGEKLSQEQMKTIIKELAKTPNNATCPHGRPTHFSLTTKELNKEFRRSS